MRYAGIYDFDVSNGIGIRVSLFVQGCHFGCDGCFNPETWDFRNGYNYDEDTEKYILNLCNKKYISGLSILGGEPLHDLNVSTVLKLCKDFKKRYPKKNIWLWTGFKMNNIVNSENKDRREILNYVDFLIDGTFDKTKKKYNLVFRGSYNQNIYEKYYDRWFLSHLNSIGNEDCDSKL